MNDATAINVVKEAGKDILLYVTAAMFYGAYLFFSKELYIYAFVTSIIGAMIAFVRVYIKAKQRAK